MPDNRDVQVHLLPDLVPCGRLAGGLAVVIDVLRATTTIVHALAAGCVAVRPCAEVVEALCLAGQMRPARCFSAANAMEGLCRASTWAIPRANTPAGVVAGPLWC